MAGVGHGKVYPLVRRIIMEELLEDLKALLIKHNAAIVRSAGDEHKMVLCLIAGEDSQNEEFDEDIVAESIEYGWHKTIAS